MQKPVDFPTSPLFLDTTPDGCRRQLAFYERAYGHVPKEQLSARVISHMEYARYMMQPANQRVGKQANIEGLEDLLNGLEGI